MRKIEMPDIMKDYTHLDTWSDTQLFDRMTALKGLAPSFGELPDEALQELLAINRSLRKRTTAPKASSSKRAPAPSLDSL